MFFFPCMRMCQTSKASNLGIDMATLLSSGKQIQGYCHRHHHHQQQLHQYFIHTSQLSIFQMCLIIIQEAFLPSILHIC